MDEWIALRCNETFVQHYQYSEHGKLLNHDTHIKGPKSYWINLRVDGGPIENYLIPPSLSAGPKAHFLYWPIQKLIECSRSNWNVNSWSHKKKVDRSKPILPDTNASQLFINYWRYKKPDWPNVVAFQLLILKLYCRLGVNFINAKCQ